ncbi:glycosyltransferase family 4 protein [Microbacterium sp. 4R-513]|uniref:glycosyltransferase n=1 Tax=Microbacterium sp. 4R-513 TaxID=2567934 RepID=UPI0013E1B170|nr:glycosyltransferase [Microbacterium sp. 4R-513]QIG38325.1 glycosyltransferase family 4 protein [Microbacterium sp. 4R-513]
MVATLRVVLDQVAAPTDADLAVASRELAAALVAAAPTGCEVEGIVPSLPAVRVDEIASEVRGLAGIHKVALARRELSAALQLGVATGIGGGMIHSPTLFAPLVKHDRVHDNDQTVVTLWDFRAWEAPDELSRTAVGWQRAMLKRAAKHADAIVVPTHSMAGQLEDFAPRLNERVRVIAGAAPAGFAVPSDEVGRRRVLDVPEGFVLISGGIAASDALALGFSAIARSGLDVPVLVIDAPEGEEPGIAELASASGLPERNLQVRGPLDTADRAAVFGAAVALLAPAVRSTFPWRVVEALALGVPVIAAQSPLHAETIVDGGMLVPADPEALGSALSDALGSTVAADRLGVLAADRGRVFSWREAADRVWQLHADL